MAENIRNLMGLDVEVPQIKLRPLDSLVAYARNSRTHSPEQVKQLQGLLLEFGWTNPVLIDDMGIAAGHGRCMAAEAIYKAGQQITFPNGTPIPIGLVPTLDCTGWTDAQRKAYIIADNRSALSAGWDEEALRLELIQLEDEGYDLSLTCFSDDELAELLGNMESPLAELPKLPTEEKEPFEKMSFTLHTDQALTVEEALVRAKRLGAFEDTGNDNSNGNALARICELFLMQNPED